MVEAFDRVAVRVWVCGLPDAGRDDLGNESRSFADGNICRGPSKSSTGMLISSLISLSDHCSRPRNPPSALMGIHLRLMFARTWSLAFSIFRLFADRGGRAASRVSGVTFNKMDDTMVW